MIAPFTAPLIDTALEFCPVDVMAPPIEMPLGVLVLVVELAAPPPDTTPAAEV